MIGGVLDRKCHHLPPLAPSLWNGNPKHSHPNTYQTDTLHNASQNSEQRAAEPASPEGRYANYIKVGYNAFEFVIDFGQLYSGEGEPNMHTRIITGPAYAKNLLALLKDSIDGFEGQFQGSPPLPK